MPKDYDKIPAPTKGATQFSKIPENTTTQRRKRISERSAGTMAYGKVKRIPAVKLIPEVIRLREAGANVPTIARTIGRSERYVRMLLQRSKGDGSQVFVQPQPKDLAKVADKYQGCLEKTGVGFEQFFLLFSGYDYLPRHAKHWVQDFLDNRRLLLNVPPGHAKSEIMSVWLPLWLICLNRNEQILIISKTNDLVQKFTRSISYQMEANLDLISAFGRFAPEPGSNWAWRPNSGELLVAGREREAQSGDLSIQIRGSGQQVYGFRATTVICDDPTDEKISDSEAERKKLSGWFHKQVMSRLDPKAKVVVIGQRVHPLDLYGELADERKTRVKDSPLAWHQIKYPAVLDWGDPEAGIEPTVLWPERWTFEDLMEQYINVGGELGFACTPAETPILMADWTEKPISKMQRGDIVMGYIEGKFDYRSPAVVSDVTSLQREVVEVELDSGRRIRCTPDHPWYVGVGKNKTYRPAEQGRTLRVLHTPLHEPNPEEREDWLYLAGIIDGEGHIPWKRPGNAVTICQSVSSPVHATIKRTLNRLGLDYHLYEAKHTGTGADLFQLRKPHRLLRMLLSVAGDRFGKSEQARIWLWNKRAMWAESREKVVSLRSCGEETVYGLTTETANYFAWGIPCHNTLYQQDPMSEGDTLVKPEWINGDNPGCLDRDRRTGSGYGDLDSIVPVVRVISIDPSPTRYTGIVVADVPYSQKTFGCAIIEVKKARLQLRDLVNEISFLLDKYHPDYLIFEKSGFSGWLYEDPYFQVIKQRVKVISHQTTGKSKGDPEYGIWGMGIDFEYGRVRLPYGDPESRDNSRILIDEATVYPYGATDDVLMALWFIKYNYKTLYPLKHLTNKIGLFQGRYPDVPTSWSAWKRPAGRLSSSLLP